MSFYNNLSADQVSSTYTLFKFLQRLRIIGYLEAHTEDGTEYEVEPFGHEDSWNFDAISKYSIVKDSYKPDKNLVLVDELLEKMFGRVTQQLRGTKY